MPLTFEGKEYYLSQTRPDIPYTIYVNEKELLLLPRVVQKPHPLFPTSPAAERRFTLRLSHQYTNELRTQYGREPKLSMRRGVSFGMEDDEVLVAAIVEGNNQMAIWEFKSLLNGDEAHTMDTSTNILESFSELGYDLSITARE